MAINKDNRTPAQVRRDTRKELWTKHAAGEVPLSRLRKLYSAKQWAMVLATKGLSE